MGRVLARWPGLLWRLIAASVYGLYFLRKERFPVLKGVDLAGMTVPIGLFFGRMGCFLGGCCFGSQCDEDFWGAVRFPGWSAASESQWKAGLLDWPSVPSLAIYPTQLYEAIGCLAIAAFCGLVVRPRKRFDGQVMLVFLALYAVLRFILEYYRADDRGAVFGLSTSQWVGVGILVVVGVFWQRLRMHAKRNLGPGAGDDAAALSVAHGPEHVVRLNTLSG